jgi:pilus assembly protein CpaF
MSLLKRLGGDPAPAAVTPPQSAATPAVQPPVAAQAAPVGPLTPPPPAPAPVITVPTPDHSSGRMLELSLQITDRILASLGSTTQLDRTPESERMLTERFANYYRQTGASLSEPQIKQLYTMVMHEIFGFGPIQRLLDDETVTEIFVNGAQTIYCERKGKVQLTDVAFLNDDHVMKIIDRIIRPLGRRVDHRPFAVDARLPDGSRVNAIIAPCAIDGPSLSIRKFSKNRLTTDDLIRFGSMTKDMAEFLRACVESKLNIVVSGGTGSGKTTLLNVLSNFIPEDDRIVTIEDSAELKLGQEHVVRGRRLRPHTQRVDHEVANRHAAGAHRHRRVP